VAVRPRTSLLLLALAGAALLASPGARGQSLDGKIDALRNQIQVEKDKEGVLSGEIAAASDGIQALEGDIGSLTNEVAGLERQLAEHRARLAKVRERYETQTRQLVRIARDHDVAQRLLEARLVELYETGPTTAIEILFGVTSVSDFVAQVEYASVIGRHDRRLADTLRRLEAEMREARRETGELRAEIAAATAAIAEKTAAAQAARDQLVARQSALESARAEKQELLASVKAERHEHEEDLDAMLAASAQLASQIQAGGSTGGAPSASGLIWPVSGPVTSGFGMRWGRMHEGIDIAAPIGTAIHAAAAGTVIFAGVMGGYGNIVVVDHGGGLSTAYAHMSAIWIAGGSVAQGASLGAVGCTGHCFGPHLHFEVRVNGSPVDPLGYL
jgi:murein DD-endopeptidase MepM/ murein hydrolase activator NlpD